MRSIRLAAAVSLISAPVLAIEPLPTETGWHGHVQPVVSAMAVRDNTLAGAGPTDVGDPRIASLDDKPGRQRVGAFSLSAEFGYMFADQGLYLYLGNRLEDVLRLDNSSNLGFRQDLGVPGILEGGFLFSPIPTRVWEDPFLVGADREETDRASSGAFLGLANILGSALDARVSFRQVDIDTERSGASLPLGASERDMLARDGDAATLDVLYQWKLGERHVLIPALSVGTYDADGGAVTRDGVNLQLTHVYAQGRWSVVSNLAYRKADFEEKNPVFGEKQDEEELLASVTGFMGRFLGVDHLSLTAGLLYAERDSRITFYDAEAMIGSLGVLYKF